MERHQPTHTQAVRWTSGLDLAHPRLARLLNITRKVLDTPLACVYVPGAKGEPERLQCSPELEPDLAAGILAVCRAAPADPHRIVGDITRKGSFPETEETHDIRFYAGHRLRAPDGTEIALFCGLDRCARSLSKVEQEIFEDLARAVESELSRLLLETVDELTALPNRRGFSFIAGRALALRERSEAPAALVTFDLQIRGTGSTPDHAAARRTFARLLLESFRDSDVIARMGDDEFCALVSPSHLDEVVIPIDRLAVAVEGWNQTADRFCLGFRHHVMEFDPEEDGDLCGLLKAAEAERHTPETSPAIGGPASILRRLARALD